MNKLKTLFWIYLLPLSGMIVFPFAKTATFNGEALGTGGLMVAGFLTGMVWDGLFLIVLATIFAITGSFDLYEDKK